MEAPPDPPYASGRRFVSSAGSNIVDYDIMKTFLKNSEDLYHFNAMLTGAIDEADSLGLGQALRDSIKNHFDMATLEEMRAIFSDASKEQQGLFMKLVKRLEEPALPISPTVTIKRKPKKEFFDAQEVPDDTGVEDFTTASELKAQQLRAEQQERKADLMHNWPEYFAGQEATEEVKDQELLNEQRKLTTGISVRSSKGKTGSAAKFSPQVLAEQGMQRSQKLLEVTTEAAKAKATAEERNLRASVEARQLQKMKEERSAANQSLEARARASAYDAKEAERRRMRRELIASAYEVMFEEPIGDAINLLGAEEEMRMAKQFYKTIGGKGSPGFLRKAYSPRAARVTTVAMEKKSAPAKRTTRKKKSVKFVLEEVDVPQKKISKRRYTKKTSGKGGKKGKGKGSKKGKGKGGKKGKGKGSKK